MKHYYTLFLLLFGIATQVCSLSAQSAPDPADTVRAMVAGMKEGTGFRGMLEFVHWETAFANVSPDQRVAMGAETPTALKDITFAFLDDPAKALQDRMQDQISKLEPEKQELTRKFIEQQQARLKTKLALAETRMVQSEYEIGKVSVDGDQATVDLNATFNGRQTERKIVLQLIEGKWYLPTSDLTGLNDTAEK